MNNKLFVFFTSLTFIFNAFSLSTGDSHSLNLNDQILADKHRGFSASVAGKRSTDQRDNQLREYYDYYFHEPEEPQCSEDEFWHVRGLRCVPFDCPGGNQFRDKHTGECLLKSYGISTGDMRGRQGRFLSRMKSPTKFRLPFGLTLKG